MALKANANENYSILLCNILKILFYFNFIIYKYF